MRIHPITGLALEDGFGALPDDLQALRIHIPYIRQWQGDAAADAMLAQLEPPAPAEPVVEPPAPIYLPPVADPPPILVLNPEAAPAAEEPHAAALQ